MSLEKGLGAKKRTEVTEAVSAAITTTSNPRNVGLIGTMDFTLRTNQLAAIATNAGLGSNGSNDQNVQSASAAPRNATSIDLISDTGGILASIVFSPSPIKMDAETFAEINFTDMFSGESLKGDVLYNLSIINNNGSGVIKKEGLIAMDSQDMQSLMFPAPGEYQISLTINGLQASTGQEQDYAPQTDRTRNGIASGSVLVAR